MKRSFKKRATVKVEDVKNEVNRMLRESTCSPAEREAMCSVLETILHATGNYRGFGYLTENEVPPGEKPGIVWAKDAETGRNYAFDFPDPSRRVYI